MHLVGRMGIGKYIWILASVLYIGGFANPEEGGRVIFVKPDGSDRNSGLSSEFPLKSIQKALNKAFAGDTVILLPGKYYENIKSVRDGEEGKPITIIGMPGSVIHGNLSPKGKVLHITHSYIKLYNLKVDGQFKNCNRFECYHDKLIYVEGTPEKPVKGVEISSNSVKNGLGECIRVKYAQDVIIWWNEVSLCGLRDFVFKTRDGQNGEGIYIGTAPEQAKKGADLTKNIYVMYNFIASYGSECIDVKEGSSNVVIMHNVCMGNQQETVGGISVRGNNNIISNNIVFLNKGAGIRVKGGG